MAGLALKPMGILGAGSWGTALALYLARRGQSVRLWSIDHSEIDAMLADKANNRFLPGCPFPDTILPMANLQETIDSVDDILIVVPSIGFRETLSKLKLTPGISKQRIICATKGLDANTGQLLSDIVEEILGKEQLFAVLSGPSFAKEVAEGLPTAVSIGCQDSAFLSDLTERFHSPLFRIYPTTDVIGVEIGGVVKNVIAIAIGISDGMGFGANMRSALITQGLAEIARLGVVLGAKTETFMGLSGMGDLILTCTDNQSRNRRFGLAIGEGQDVQAAEKSIGQVVEGKRNAELVSQLAKKHRVSMPICETVWKILQGNVSSKEAVAQLLSG